MTDQSVDARDSRAAAVVGVGLRTPAGNCVEDLWAAVCAGRSTAEVFEDPRLPAGSDVLVCRVHDDGASLSPIEARRLDRSHALAIGAAEDALRAAGELPAPERCAVVCGVGLPAAGTYEQQLGVLLGKGARALSPVTIPMIMPSSVSAHLSMRFGFTGPCVTVSAACASGAAAIAEGVELLRRGAADLVLAGGVDALLTYGVIAGFLKLDAMSHRVSDPEHASRPFDAGRDGFVIAEGAGFVVLRRYDDVSARTPAPVGLVLGHASTADAHHLVAPAEDGAGAQRCMRLALLDAHASRAEVQHINAHGTSTVLNDRVEAIALRALFDGHPPPVTATKGTTGHMIAGSGAVEAIVAMVSTSRKVVPPVAGLCTLEEDIGLDVVMDHPRAVPSGLAISNSFGFGGTNTTLVLGAAP